MERQQIVVRFEARKNMEDAGRGGATVGVDQIGPKRFISSPATTVLILPEPHSEPPELLPGLNDITPNVHPGICIACYGRVQHIRSEQPQVLPGSSAAGLAVSRPGIIP